jgi:hypothetical protein
MFPFQGRTRGILPVSTDPSEKLFSLTKKIEMKYPKLFNKENIANNYIRSNSWWDKIGFDTNLETIPVDFLEDLENRLKKQFGKNYSENREQQIDEMLNELEFFRDEDKKNYISDKNNFLKIFY